MFKPNNCWNYQFQYFDESNY